MHKHINMIYNINIRRTVLYELARQAISDAVLVCFNLYALSDWVQMPLILHFSADIECQPVDSIWILSEIHR